MVAEITKNLNSGQFVPVLVTVIEDSNKWMEKTNGWGMILFQVVTQLIAMTTLVLGIRGKILFALQQGDKINILLFY